MSTSNELPEIGPRDIVFDCPFCEKSMVVDEVAVGMTVECPRCGGQVIVPPRPNPTAPPPVMSPPAADDARISALISKLKELQTQRTEISTNIVARLNDINRQMVLLARLESAHQQVIQEWNRLLAESRSNAGSPQANFKA